MPTRSRLGHTSSAQLAKKKIKNEEKTTNVDVGRSGLVIWWEGFQRWWEGIELVKGTVAVAVVV